jgi:pimeloyl-ACP methyl ester carboxylesterase
VLLLHGLPTSRHLWRPVARRLAESFRVVVVDLPGFGDTPPLPSGLREPAPLLAGLEAVRRTVGAERWCVAGHDAGATVAVHYAAAHPGRVPRLALLSPPLFPDFRPPWPFRWLRWRGVGELLAPLLLALVWRGGLRRAVAAPGAEVDAIVAGFGRPFRGAGGGRRFLHLVRWGEPHELLGRTAALLPAIAAPTLLLQGRRDRLVPHGFARRAAAAVPRGEAAEIDAGHFLPLDADAEVARRLGEWFAGAE